MNNNLLYFLIGMTATPIFAGILYLLYIFIGRIFKLIPSTHNDQARKIREMNFQIQILERDKMSLIDIISDVNFKLSHKLELPKEIEYNDKIYPKTKFEKM